MPYLLKLSEVSYLLGVSTSTIRRMVKKGDIPKPYKVSKKSDNRFTKFGIKKYLVKKGVDTSLINMPWGITKKGKL